ncbi:hypothetical protein EGT07_13345 [Herbaspirillum sp. HC18]|nr:hypothetical protein EGT07_13345 [Herbaspirillum sp. HC18]
MEPCRQGCHSSACPRFPAGVSIMFELRVLSGLHRGATLPLDGRPHVIGASEDADVVLVDPGIAEKHATLTLADSGWQLSALGGTLRTADTNRPETSIDLPIGGFARAGDVWLTVVDEDTAWENPPPEPVDPPAEIAMDPAGEIPEPEAVEQAAQASEEMPQDAEPAVEEEQDQLPSKPRWLGRRVVYIPIAATVLSAAAAYAITSRSDTALSAKKIEALSRNRQGPSGKPGDKTIAAAFDSLNKDGTAERPLTADELRKAFRKKLSDADLLKSIDLTLQDNQWLMQGALDDEEAARFERILAAFTKQHNITFPVHAKVVSLESMLPFKIRQVIFGADASVVTQEGDRLFVGDEYRGVRLVAIDAGQVVFAGKRKIVVKL